MVHVAGGEIGGGAVVRWIIVVYEGKKNVSGRQVAAGSAAARGQRGCFRGAGGTSGLPEMKSHNPGLSGLHCGKEKKGCLFTFHIRPRRPCPGGRLPRGKDTWGALQDTQYPTSLSEARRGPSGPLAGH